LKKSKTCVFTVGSRDDEMLRISSLSQREGKAKLCSLLLLKNVVTPQKSGELSVS